MATTRVFYINLDHRVDRRVHIEHQLVSMNLPWTRIPAIHEPKRGILGCGKSHVLAMQAFIRSGADRGIIFEDDFTFANTAIAIEQFKQFFEIPNFQWDVVMLAGNGSKENNWHIRADRTEWPFLAKVYDATTTSGYMVTKAFAPVLLQNLQEGVSLLDAHFQRFGIRKHDYCLDVYWKKLQPISNWFIFVPKMGYQADSYSDIENVFTQYRT